MEYFSAIIALKKKQKQKQNKQRKKKTQEEILSTIPWKVRKETETNQQIIKQFLSLRC